MRFTRLFKGSLRLVATALLLASSAAVGTETAKARFTVADSIGWTAVLNFEGDYRSNPISGTALFSPDGQRFAIHTRKGILDRNVTVETLLVFDTRAVTDFVRSNRADRPSPIRTFDIELTRDSGSLAHIQWLDAARLAFIAEGRHGVNQLFVADVRGHNLEQVTDSATDVTSFAASDDVVLYYARQPLGPLPLVNSVGDRTFSEVLYERETDDTPLELFRLSLRTKAITRLAAPAVRLLDLFQGIWLAPSGRYAIVFVPVTNAPPHWRQYRIPNQDLFGSSGQRIPTDPLAETDREDWFHTQYALVDVKQNRVTALLDAPSGWLAQNGTPIGVFWPQRGEHTVLITDTFLPLLNVSDATREPRTRHPAIAEVNLESGAVNVVLWEPSRVSAPSPAKDREGPWIIESIAWDERVQALRVVQRISNHDGRAPGYQTSVLQKKGSAWRRTVVPRSDAERAHPLAIHLNQNLNSPPRIIATTRGDARELYDPNPQAAHLAFGQTEIVTWKDSRHDVTWKGGLLRPPDAAPGRRYPLIVQTHGFDEHQFLLDGPGAGGSTAMAAQAFANAGFFVLQIEDKPFSVDEAEGVLFADGFEAGIQSLIERGEIDSSRVGLIAFSRSGFHAIHLLARYPHLLKAINISDAVQIGYLSHVLLTNSPRSTQRQLESMSGGPPTLANAGEWFARNPTYALAQTSAAVRLEANSIGAVLGMWEAYSMLRNAGRAVDLVYFPEGSHVQTRPAERLGSQGGNLDWFRFWLTDEVDPAAEKAAQYRRWVQLRAPQVP
jgi:hypothetical protein